MATIAPFLGGFDNSIAVGCMRTVFGVLLSSFILRPIYKLLLKSKASILVLGLLIFLICGGISYLEIEISEGLKNELSLFGIPPEVIWSSEIRRVLLFSRWLILTIWSLLYVGICSWRERRQDELRMVTLESANRQAELQLLRAQVNPHFLFNALNSTLAEKDNPARVESIIQALAEYLRFSMTQGEGLVILGLELDAISNYLKVEKFRFEEHFEYSIDASEEARNLFAPTALLQPLVENAIKFGRATSHPLLKVHISVRRNGDRLQVDVSNSGHWVDHHDKTKSGIGLSNLRRRLDLLYQGSAKLDPVIEAHLVRIQVNLPAVEMTTP